MNALPLMLDGSRFTAVVVGGGSVALRKVRALLEGGVGITVVAPTISDGLRELAAANDTIRITNAAYDASLIGAAMLVVAATDDAAVNAAVARDAMQQGRLVNVADDPEAGNFVTPAVHRVGDLIVAVSSGRLPGAAAAVRNAIADRFDARYAAAIAELRELRGRLLRKGDADAWKAIATDVFGDDFCTKIETGTLDAKRGEWP